MHLNSYVICIDFLTYILLLRLLSTLFQSSCAIYIYIYNTEMHDIFGTFLEHITIDIENIFIFVGVGQIYDTYRMDIDLFVIILLYDILLYLLLFSV